MPVVGHETGQYQVSPDFSEIPKYTGVLRARNLEIFRERLEAAGMLDQADDFLNAFMESKGLIEPERWREFCCETVTLLWMKKYTWTTGEMFTGRIRVAHYGPAELPDARITWTVTDEAGTAVQSGVTAPSTIRPGEASEIDLIAFPLAPFAAPQKLQLELSITGTPFRNTYPLWIYPSEEESATKPDIHLCSKLDKKAHPEARQFLHSIQTYMQTDAFAPTHVFDIDWIDNLLHTRG